LLLLLQAAGKVVAFAELPGVLARLSAMAAQLDACQRALAEFLEEKRAAFPRCAALRMRHCILSQQRSPRQAQA
jgi:dynein heavy chain 2